MKKAIALALCLALCLGSAPAALADGPDEDIAKILSKSYAVLESEADTDDELKEALVREFGYLGFTVDTGAIVITSSPTAIENGYGTFTFTVTVGEVTSESQTGYIVEAHTDVIFKYDGTHDDGTPGGEPVSEILVAGHNGELGAPAMDAGTLEVFGVYNVGIEGVISQDVRDAFVPEEVDGNRSRYTLTRAFYRAQLHIANACATDLESGLNWFMFDLIQDDALCVEVSASGVGEAPEQRTWQWELNRYAELTEGPYTSEVYFANDVLTLSLPASDIGGAETLEMTSGSFPGYTVTESSDGGTYSVEFLSNFYDAITLDLTITDTQSDIYQRQLTIRRVGVHIADYQAAHEQTSILHGTQPGSVIDYDGGVGYCVYATYYIPDGGEDAPYGLYVTYTWADGTATAEIVSSPVDAPPEDLDDSIGHENGVFLYNNGGNNLANACDYLLYSAANDTNAPVRVSVTVLKDDPTDADEFGGVWFGSGAGVTWEPTE